ncbi:thiamine pyrophosphate-binding protein [Aquicoccus porphyridii]|uniref:Thiamine pyrophosphate-binding protein n=1 Tax=Aquicoccus porphyridii TaxID=1852029 RepID=A0A5A9Z6R4_9RHOB|nr:thiamine pyrophosphate-binding protein [Aquicoccus porphyridii]KAA0912880.1 thiamine pyrophosphate-binding protein [Aquicoccus porphyridii]RAI54379.1 thiamine pyrophosphate-binding protein [Rhodobacteraceae bacterium AsT-22]
MSSNEMTGGEALVRMLLAHGAGPMFGMGGFQLLPFYDAARRLGLKHNLINDERCAVFAADAYAKVSGRVGLVDATLGPGATNLVTGLVEALNAGSPIVAIIGDAQRDHAGKNMTQETDQVSILRPACKELLRIESIQRIPEIMRRAFAVATSGRPGPVVVDVPEDIAHGLWGYDDGDFDVDPAHEAAPALRCRPDVASIARAADMIAGAERPILLCGGGIHISQATGAVTRFAEENGIPVAHTMSGKGAIACTSPLSAGLFGRYDRIANDLIAASDCIVVTGCKLGEIATKRFSIPHKGQRVIHLDNVAEEMGRTYEPALKLWGDAREGLDALTEAMADTAGAQRARRADYLAEIPVKMQAWHDEVAADRLYSDESPVHMARLITELNRHLPADGYLIADGGFAAHWGGLLFNSKEARRSFVPDRGFASIGYGLPGAMGAQLADPEAVVVGLTGDGGFNMVLGELETARRMGLGLTVIVVNNAASGYVKALQHLMYGEGNYQSSDLAETNYAKVAEAMGCHGIRVEEPGELEGALKAAFAERNRPSVIDVMVTRDPARMLPAVDNRTVQVKKGDRVA